MSWRLEFEQLMVYIYPIFLQSDAFGENENYPDREGEEDGEDFFEWGEALKVLVLPACR